MNTPVLPKIWPANLGLLTLYNLSDSPGRASNRNQKKNGRGLRPLRVLYVGPFWGPIPFARYYQEGVEPQLQIDIAR